MTKHLIAKTLGTYINLIGHLRPDTATALAYRFFSRPRAGRLTENKLPRVLAEAKHETFTLPNGDRFRTYRWTGNNTVIMLRSRLGEQCRPMGENAASPAANRRYHRRPRCTGSRPV